MFFIGSHKEKDKTKLLFDEDDDVMNISKLFDYCCIFNEMYAYDHEIVIYQSDMDQALAILEELGYTY